MVESVMNFFGEIAEKVVFFCDEKDIAGCFVSQAAIVLARSPSSGRVLATNNHLSFQIHVDRT
jgi:hypothetical protein